MEDDKRIYVFQNLFDNDTKNSISRYSYNRTIKKRIIETAECWYQKDKMKM